MQKIAAFLLCLLAQPVLAAMSLDKIIVHLNDQPNSREDILVSNPDPETLYLQTEIYRVDNPGMPDENRVRVVDPKEFKLLVSPARAVIGAGEKKRFRLMSLEQNLQQEKVYRVTFKPVVGDVKTDRSALKVLVAYQILVFVQPEDGLYRIALERSGGELQLVNKGNINVEVGDVQHCLSDDNCKSLATKGRLYAGASLPLNEKLSGGYLRLQVRGRISEEVRLPL
ncbi:fimbria/pilus periplasmic chaperone [Microbulbifer aggregans]|uniref:fimbria/pilus periplasmic chaperone n=1 Tax=Microbulbifer aggregans TaxID=1769779 RepID=UPI001CFDB112|nr:fimbria/pilus periplasmic chaperone [Microbulbifer aggregans]